MKLNSKRVNIEYQPGEEIFTFPDETGLSFIFDVDKELTCDPAAMEIAGQMLDEAEAFAEKAKEVLKKVLADEEHEDHGTVAYFMEFHRDEVDPDTAAALFPGTNPVALTFGEMVDYLKLKRFGSCVHYETKKQAFILDLAFNPEITDELMVVYFDLGKEAIGIAHES